MGEDGETSRKIEKRESERERETERKRDRANGY